MKIKQKIYVLALSTYISSFVLASPVMATTECYDSDGHKVYSTSILGCANDLNSLLIMIAKILTAGVLIAAVAGIIFGAVLYMTAGGSADKTKKGVTVIRDVIIGLVVYGLMYVILNFIIPGGVPLL